MVAPDDAAQDVERGVRAHQPMPALPVELDLHRVADRRHAGLGMLELVPQLRPVLADRVTAQRLPSGALSQAWSAGWPPPPG